MTIITKNMNLLDLSLLSCGIHRTFFSKLSHPISIMERSVKLCVINTAMIIAFLHKVHIEEYIQ